MKEKEQKAEWREEMSEQVFEDVLKWREKHPHATIREIEKELMIVSLSCERRCWRIQRKGVEKYQGKR
jgi:hypothetical protein